MTGGLTVFIDEGGDSGVRDGLRFQHTRHEWFSLSAFVVRNEIEPTVVEWRDQIMSEAKVRQSPSLHYYKLKPDRRLQVCQILGVKPARALCLLSHKANMRNYYSKALGKFDAKKFYNWCSRLLLERVIEFAEVDAARRSAKPQPLRIIFSQNLGHDYEAMFSYFELLNMQVVKNQTVLKPKRWNANFMQREFWSVRPHNDLAGLQLADTVASAFLQGANSNAASYDTAPAKALHKIMARGANGEKANAGVTLWPLLHQGPIPDAARPIFEHFGYRF